MMPNAYEIEHILRETLPLESELAGDAHLLYAAQMASRGIALPVDYSPMPGHKLEPVAAIVAIAAAANCVKTSVDVYIQLRKLQSRAPTRGEYDFEVAKQTASMTETMAKLIAAVFALLSGKQ